MIFTNAIYVLDNYVKGYENDESQWKPSNT